MLMNADHWSWLSKNPQRCEKCCVKRQISLSAKPREGLPRVYGLTTAFARNSTPKFQVCISRSSNRPNSVFSTDKHNLPLTDRESR